MLGGASPQGCSSPTDHREHGPPVRQEDTRFRHVSVARRRAERARVGGLDGRRGTVHGQGRASGRQLRPARHTPRRGKLLSVTDTFVAVAQVGSTLAAFVGIFLTNLNVRRSRRDAERQRHSDSQVEIVLKISEAYEQWVMGHGGDTLGMTVEAPSIRPKAGASVRALLAALPVNDLPILRSQFGILPESSHYAESPIDGDDEDGLVGKAREQIRSLLEKLRREK